MNFLAHIYLSGNDPLTQIGNFVGDWVKGSLISVNAKYPPQMALGIRMHRFIDSFTDTNPIVAQSTAIFRPALGKYAGVAVDVIYDHFLAKDWNSYADTQLDTFVQNFYTSCIKYFDILPKKLQPLIPHLILSNRLKSYYNIKGVEAAFRTMECQTSFPANTDETIEALKQNYNVIQQQFNDFFGIITKTIGTEFKVKHHQ